MTAAEARLDGFIVRLDSMSSRVIDLQKQLEAGFTESREWQRTMATRVERWAQDAAATRAENAREHEAITGTLREVQGTMAEFIRCAEAVVRR